MWLDFTNEVAFALEDKGYELEDGCVVMHDNGLIEVVNIKLKPFAHVDKKIELQELVDLATTVAIQSFVRYKANIEMRYENYESRTGVASN